ncbi:MAG: Multidrug resistance protein Stp [Candidatus Ordinivivax streblomastigis]|uniref:Multidrug resistance protein Stp n=1 Tax=Candidatus Ordinivivax streblomastigis TaxID=2540710 RepID=A0A5M8NYI3_9BACT|nr:MAG: Multidrug resistance protein Stp [Candidatus Ordinivivax streblomastigis]
MTWTHSQKVSLLIVSTASFLGTFLASSVNIALPTIEKQFELNAVLLSWIIIAFLLSTSIVMLPMGKWADLHGIKKVFKWGLAGCAAGTVLCAVSPNGYFLIVSRFVQGCGYAMCACVGNAILVSMFPPNQKGSVLGISIALIYAGLSMGPLIGGLLTEYLGWRSIFYIVAAIQIVDAIAAFILLGKDKLIENSTPVNFKGIFAYVAALIALIYGSSTIPQVQGWISIVAGAVFMLGFFLIENRSKFPVLDVKLFTKNRLFAFSTLSALINYSATYAIIFLLSLYLQKIKMLSPKEAGFILLTQPLVMAIFSPIAGRLSDCKIEPRWLTTTGMVLCTLGLAAFAFLSESTSIYLIIGVLAMVGLGFALFSSPNMRTIMGSVEKSMYGLATSITETMRSLGQMVSITISTLLISMFLGSIQIVAVPNDAFIKMVSISFGIFAAICAVGVVFSYYRGNSNRSNT